MGLSTINRRSGAPGVHTRASVLLLRRSFHCCQNILELHDGYSKQSREGDFKHISIRSSRVE